MRSSRRASCARAALALALLLPRAGRADEPAGPRPPQACIGPVAADGRAATAALLAVLERALGQADAVAARRPAACAAAAGGLPPAARSGRDPAALQRAMAAYQLDLLVTARLVRHGGRHRLTLVAYEVRRGEVARVHRDLRRPRVPAPRAGELLGELLAAATARRGEPAAPASAPASAPAPGGDDDAAWTAATAQAPAAAVPAAAPAATLEIGARLFAQHFSYFKTPPALGGNRDEVELALTVKGQARRVKALGTLLVRRDFTDATRDRFDAAEVSVETTLFGRLTLRAGRLIVAWGSTTLANPADLLNPVDLRDPVATEKLGAVMLRASLELGRVIVEGYLLPLPEQSLLEWPDGVDAAGLPTSRSRWALPFPAQTSTSTGLVALRYQLALAAVPRPAPSHTQAAARVTVAVLGADVALSYGFLFDRLPEVRTTVTPVAPDAADALVERGYGRLHVATLELERAVGRVRLAAEAVAIVTEDRSARDPLRLDPYLVWVAGADYQTPAFFHDHTLHFFVEYLDVRALRGSLDTGANGLVRYPLTHAVLGRVAYETGRWLNVELNVGSAVDGYNLIINPKLELTLHDKVKLSVEAAVLRGDPARLFGIYHNNSRVAASVEARY